MYMLDTTKLASYPGVRIPSADTADLVARLVEAKVNRVIGDATVEAADIDPIALESASRALTNPTGATSITSGIDDWKQTLRYEGDTALSKRAGVYLTADEKAELRELAGITQPAAAGRRRRSIVTMPGF